MNFVFEYIKYRWNAKGRHGIHSPFVYELLDKGFKIGSSEAFFKSKSELFSSYQTNRTVIEVEDFGAGSKYFAKKRKVSEIFRRSASRGKKSRILRQLVQHFQPENVLEMGTSLGIGTFCMAFENEATNLVTVEACPTTLSLAKQQFEKYQLKNIESVNSTFEAFLTTYTGPKWDFVFIDGHHDGDALLRYLTLLDPLTHDETIFVLDDIRWSDSMISAFDAVVESEKFHVTMDLFQIGIVVKRKHQRKEHFVLKAY